MESEDGGYEPVVLMQYLPLVRMQEDWGNLTWPEIVEKFPLAETKAMIFILGIFQVRAAADAAPPTT